MFWSLTFRFLNWNTSVSSDNPSEEALILELLHFIYRTNKMYNNFKNIILSSNLFDFYYDWK